jgi:uncharacterized protein YdeI (BOF family)
MKRNLITVLSLLVSLSAFSQEKISNESRTQNGGNSLSVPTATEPVTTESKKEVVKNKPITISKRAGEPQRVHNQAYYQEEIAKIDTHITAIDTKVNHVNNDPAEKQAAEANGWFVQMSEIKQNLQLKRAKLVEKMNNL